MKAGQGGGPAGVGAGWWLDPVFTIQGSPLLFFSGWASCGDRVSYSSCRIALPTLFNGLCRPWWSVSKDVRPEYVCP